MHRAATIPPPPRAAPLAALAVACALASAAPAARAADYYVATTGADTDDGSMARPWRTINHAAGAVHAGDTVHVAAGVYREAVRTGASGTATARIRYVSDARWGARVDATGQYTAWNNAGSYADIEGFDITGANYLGVLNTGSFVRVLKNHVHHLATPSCNSPNGGAGIDHGDYAAHDNDTIGNMVDHILPPQPCNQIHGIYHSNLRGHIVDNIAFQTGGWGIHLWHAPQQVTIANNLVFGHVQGGMVIGAGDAPGGVTADQMLVVNNVVVHNTGYGIVESGLTGASNRYVNNLVWSNGSTDVRLLTGMQSGTIMADPRLVDFQLDGTGDYHLTAASPCVDRGTSMGAPADDYDGNPRPAGAAVDIGPYEYGAAPPDAGALDAGAPDAAARDAGAVGPDAGLAGDTGAPRGDGAPDGDARSDGGRADGSGDGARRAGCACRGGATGDAGGGVLAGALLAVALARRRRVS